MTVCKCGKDKVIAPSRILPHVVDIGFCRYIDEWSKSVEIVLNCHVGLVLNCVTERSNQILGRIEGLNKWELLEIKI